MADFNKAYNVLEKWEGGYSNIKEDLGGETYKGITRKNYPNMSFWNKLDEVKKMGLNTNEINNYFKTYVEIDKEVKAFYKKNYWDTYKGDEIACQDFATNLLLLSVNAGIKRGLKVGQEACNITPDGIYGKQTQKAFNSATKSNVDRFNIIELEYYRSIVKKRPQNAKFLKGWENRAKTI